jgi:hypothetical protein
MNNKEQLREETPEQLLIVLQAYFENDLEEMRFPHALAYLNSWIKYRSSFIKEAETKKVEEIRGDIESMEEYSLGDDSLNSGYFQAKNDILTLPSLNIKKDE